MLYIFSMMQRALYSIVFSQTWGRQMRFITGPRQSGKTTLAKQKLEIAGSPELYFLWDLREVRRRYKENQLFFTENHPPSKTPQWVCFDEIHKIPKWKNGLKAIFDASQEDYRFIVTGSAKLEIFKKAGDSLSGRYFTFHLFPLALSELSGSKSVLTVEDLAPKTAHDWIQQILDFHELKNTHQNLSDLLEYGGFPEPFLKQSHAFHMKWRKDYADTVIREDIGALTRIIDKEYLYDLYQLLPEMVGSHISESSIASHLQISGPTVKSYLRRLEDFYLTFRVRPYFKNIKRALLKTPKCYLYDYTMIGDAGKRFENFVAIELMSRIHLWMDAGSEDYSLFYVRNKEGQETDFLILKNSKPWLLLEAKLSDSRIDGHHYKTQAMLGGIPLVQLCRKDGVCRMEGKNIYQISAARFFSS